VVQKRVVEEEGNVVLVDQFCDYVDIWVLFLYDIVLEDGLGVKQVFLVFRLLLILTSFITCSLRAGGPLLLLEANVWCKDDNLLRLHDVHTVVGLLL